MTVQQRPQRSLFIIMSKTRVRAAVRMRPRTRTELGDSTPEQPLRVSTTGHNSKFAKHLPRTKLVE